MKEYEVIKTCLKANLEIISMCQESNHEKKNLILETIIPIFENRIEESLKN